MFRRFLNRLRGTQHADGLRAALSRAVHCYHCGSRITVPAAAISTSCPYCFKQLTVDDVVIPDRHWGGTIQTSGTIRILRGARCMTHSAVAGTAVEIEGFFAGDIACSGTVRLGRESVFRGRIRCTKLEIEGGAVIEAADIRTNEQPLAKPHLLPKSVPPPRRAGVLTLHQIEMEMEPVRIELG